MVIVQLIGGLGNQMFQYACGRHLALLNNTELKLDLSFLQNRMKFRENFVFRDYDLDIFNIKAEPATNAEIPLYPGTWRINSIPHRLINLFAIKARGFKYILEWKLKSYQRIRYNDRILKKRGNLYLAGYWASPNYFDNINEVIRADFTFRERLSDHAQLLAENIQSVNSICINVRRKEFLLVKTMGFHGMEYIQRAVNYMILHVKNPVFFIFSDDLEWCKQQIHLSFPMHFVNESYYGNKFSEYMQLMMMCRHFIIPNSSFAWWAAWLSSGKDKIVTTPENYFLGFETKDLIPKDWIKIKLG